MPLITTPRHLARRAELYHQLAAMLGAGVTLIRALEISGRDPRGRIPRRTLDQLLTNLRSGHSFTESLGMVQGALPDFDKALLGVGEKSGRLDEVFRVLGQYYQTRAKIIRDTITGMIITIATLHVFLMVFPLGYLIKFAQGFVDGSGFYWPFVIEKVICFGGLYTVVFLFIFASQAGRGEAWRSVVERIMRCVPILRTAQRDLALSRTAGALEALVNAGVSIVTGWELAAQASGSPALKREVASWKEHLYSGSTPGQIVTASRYFPPTFADLYATAEQSGKLDEALGRLQSYYQEEGFRTLRIFTTLMNGLIYTSVAVMVAYYVINFWMNYFGAIGRAADGM